jgi:hypothetical protein
MVMRWSVLHLITMKPWRSMKALLRIASTKHLPLIERAAG